MEVASNRISRLSVHLYTNGRRATHISLSLSHTHTRPYLCVHILHQMFRTLYQRLKLTNVLGRAARVLWNHLSDGTDFDEDDLMVTLIRLLSTLSGRELPDISSRQSSDDNNNWFDSGSYRFSSKWQSQAQKDLSLVVYNCAISTNVAQFSGWEQAEFDGSLLRRKGSKKDFGVTLHFDKIMGNLGKELSSILCGLWKLLNNQIRDDDAYDFESNLKKATTVAAPASSPSDASTPPVSQPPVEGGEALYGEWDALLVSMVLCGMCLRNAAKNSQRRNMFLGTALSIMIPLVS